MFFLCRVKGGQDNPRRQYTGPFQWHVHGPKLKKKTLGQVWIYRPIIKTVTPVLHSYYSKKNNTENSQRVGDGRLLFVRRVQICNF